MANNINELLMNDEVCKQLQTIRKLLIDIKNVTSDVIESRTMEAYEIQNMLAPIPETSERMFITLDAILNNEYCESESLNDIEHTLEEHYLTHLCNE